jgi:hypothetical protein
VTLCCGFACQKKQKVWKFNYIPHFLITDNIEASEPKFFCANLIMTFLVATKQ